MRALPAQKAVAAAERPSTPAVSRFQLSLFPLAVLGLGTGEGNLASGRAVG